MAITYTNFVQYRTLEYLPKLGFWVRSGNPAWSLGRRAPTLSSHTELSYWTLICANVCTYVELFPTTRQSSNHS
jgi:hypothetical protein